MLSSTVISIQARECPKTLFNKHKVNRQNAMFATYFQGESKWYDVVYSTIP